MKKKNGSYNEYQRLNHQINKKIKKDFRKDENSVTKRGKKYYFEKLCKDLNEYFIERKCNLSQKKKKEILILLTMSDSIQNQLIFKF